MTNRKKYPISEVAQNEIDRFRREIAALDAGTGDMDNFKRFRLNNGIYGIRFKDDEHMIRIKIPFGDFTADQLEVIADLAEKYTPGKLSHVTTRQAIQLHNLKRKDVPDLLTELHEAGLTSREACGNTVRNVTCDERAGIDKEEVFDVNPYADLLYRYFLRNPLNQNLPRKFKIAFESVPDSDRARVGIHDVGFRAKIKKMDGKDVRGFEMTVGGGLGTLPFAAYPLEDFVPVTEFLHANEAVLRLFDRYGERRDKNRARLKFLIDKWGIEEFSKRYFEEKKIAMATDSGRHESFKIELKEETAPTDVSKDYVKGVEGPDFKRWKKTNVFDQKQSGFHGVYIRCLYGDLTHEQAYAAAAIARDFGGGHIRTTITQNLLLRWIPTEALPTVYQRLQDKGLGLDNAQNLADITRCPGADTCNLAVTHSKGLARHLTEKVFQNGFATDEEIKDISIKISGCTNSCGQHHIANIGFYGASRRLEGKPVAHYQLLVGGRTGLKREDVKFGDRIVFLPARRIDEAVKALLTFYKKGKKGQESFLQWYDRVGADPVRKEMEPFSDIGPLKGDPKLFEDLGDEGNEFVPKVGKGECAA